MINVGIVGLGHVASHQMAAIAHSNRFRLTAGCDLDQERLVLLDSGVARYTDFDAMLSHSPLDVVVVASPNRLHVEHALRALEAGKRVLIEKPIAEDRAGFERLDQARLLGPGRCSLALHAAFGPEIEWFCAEIEAGHLDLGRLNSFACRFYDPYFEGGRRVDHAASLGGAWIDSGINALSVIGRLIPPEALSIEDSRMTRVNGSGCTEVQGTVDFRFARNGATGVGSIDTNWTLGRDRKLTRLLVDDGAREFTLDHSAQSVVLRRADGDRQLFECGNALPRLTNHYIGVFADLARQIDADHDNFDYGRALHELFYSAAETRARRGPGGTLCANRGTDT
jgi:D-galactose 1-dehydrogenase